jgi:hypothetical protein
MRDIDLAPRAKTTSISPQVHAPISLPLHSCFLDIYPTVRSLRLHIWLGLPIILWGKYHLANPEIVDIELFKEDSHRASKCQEVAHFSRFGGDRYN